MRTILVLCLLLLCAGCRTLQPVDHADWASVSTRVEPGDTVEVTTRDGERRRFEVTAMGEDSIAGADGRIAASDIESMRVLAISKGRTAAATVGGVAVGYAVLYALAFVALLGAL